MNSNGITLSINGDAFNGMKEDFDKVLKRTLANMEQKSSSEATLTVKLAITLEKFKAVDFDSPDPDATKDIKMPRFDHKISSVMQVKTEEKGCMKGDYELVWDSDRQDYIMRPIYDGQQSLVEDDEDNVVDTKYAECDEEVAAIAANDVLALPDDITIDSEKEGDE